MGIVVPRVVDAFASLDRNAAPTAVVLESQGASGLIVSFDVETLPAATKEITTVGIGTSTGGTFILTYAGVASSAIDFDATAAEMDTIIEAITGVTTSSVTGGNATLDYEVATIDRGTSTGGTWNVTLDSVQTAEIAFDASAAVVKAAFELVSSITTVSVAGTGTGGDPWVCTFDDPIKDITITSDDALLTGGDATLTVVNTTDGVPATDFVITVDTPTENFYVTGDSGVSLTGTGASLSVVNTQVGAEGDGTLTLNIDMPDGNGNDVTILDSTAIATAITTVLKVNPSLTAGANLIAKDLVPNQVKFSVAHSTADHVTYRVIAHFVA
jgi:hypothetical protein